MWAGLVSSFRSLNTWQSIRVDWGVLTFFGLYSRARIRVRSNSVERWGSRHLKWRQSDVFRNLVNVFHGKQLFVIRGSRLALSRRCFVESRAERIPTVRALHRLQDLVFWDLVLVRQEVRNTHAKLLLNDLVSQLELFFEMLDYFVALLNVEFSAVLPSPDVQFS